MKNGCFGEYGGRFVPETLIPALEETSICFEEIKQDECFKKELSKLLKDFVGRPTPLYYAHGLSKKYDAKIYLKREDLCHTGSHKINNALGQALMAQRMSKKHLIAETGAGQHGVATATCAAYFGMKCTIFMGVEDMERQALNVERMKLLGAEVKGVDTGSKTLKDAINEAMRYWTKYVEDTHYLFGSVLGPYPFPEIVRYFQSVIGKEARKDCLDYVGQLPDKVIACVGGGSNAMGIFSGFLKDSNVELIGVEAGGFGNHDGEHAARFIKPSKGVLHGAYSYMLQKDGQVLGTHSVAPGLDYPMIGPEHADLYDKKRAQYDYLNDDEAIHGFEMLSLYEGIIPALESSHAVGYLEKIKEKIQGQTILINLSGRGDKDLTSYLKYKKGVGC